MSDETTMAERMLNVLAAQDMSPDIDIEFLSDAERLHAAGFTADDLAALWDEFNEATKNLPLLGITSAELGDDLTKRVGIAKTKQARVRDAGLCGEMHPRNLWVCNNFRDHDDNHKVIPEGAFGAAILDAKPTHEWARLVAL